ncbi:Putative membrane protein, clustering with ActP (plasmid) [Rhodovulum sp. P5]|uniref:DUF485 domain-containing protein n=1 Tax=Rhodovulum sp. P5 TaxID=1564506 RepID=UPI0009C2CB22|nr:DUF485 domain-containing protein [Rhodovulum sp. P5]ARE42373.1 Putative membrane protein, clustering with ActP [Rhodovulum sp. P5]
MPETVYARVKQDPRFDELTRRRGRFAVTLSVLVLVVYYSFIMVVAFRPDWLAQPIADGFTTTLGIPIGVAIIIGAWLTTGIYVRRANTEFDRLNDQIVKDATT